MRTPKDWGQPCPNPACIHYRRMQQGIVSAIATYLTQSGKRRIFRCPTCETPFSATRATVFCDLRTSEEKIMMALKMLLVRGDLAGIGFVLGVTEATVLAWLRRAAQQAEALNQHLLRHLPMTQGNWTRCGALSRANTLGRQTRPAKAGPEARLGGKGAGSALPLSFV